MIEGPSRRDTGLFLRRCRIRPEGSRLPARGLARVVKSSCVVRVSTEGPEQRGGDGPRSARGTAPPGYSLREMPEADEHRHLVQVRVDLPNHWAATGESLAAEDLGGGRYRIQSVPTHAYGINRLDLVEAVAGSPGPEPEVRRVIARSEHQTLRVRFLDGISRAARHEYLESLNEFGVEFEPTHRTLVALDLPPGTRVTALCARLDAWEHDGVADWESCEERAAGRFDEGLD